MNYYPTWKYLLILLVIGSGMLYALPNLYGKVPALQVSSNDIAEDLELLEFTVGGILDEANLNSTKTRQGAESIIFHFTDESAQLQARDALQAELGRKYVVALHSASNTPDWLRQLSAEPMFLGLDLRGGVHFLLEMDLEAVADTAIERYVSDLRSALREERIRYKTVTRRGTDRILVRLRNADDAAQVDQLIREDFPELEQEQIDDGDGEPDVLVWLNEQTQLENRRLALQQNITTLRKRVNELGISEPVVQQHGQTRVVVQLPGIQDTARAKDILGATATLEFRLADEENDVQQAIDGRIPQGSRLYYTRGDEPVLLKKEIITTGSRIIAAQSGIDQRSNSPAVFINMDGQGARQMTRHTRDNIGRLMAVVYLETKSWEEEENGEKVRRKETIEEIISLAEIKDQLGKRFQITGLDSTREARDLALLLRAGALSAPINLIEERTVGPSLGQDNIDKGSTSIMLGLGLVLIFMVLYYRAFGLIADVALLLNLTLLVALLSMLQATLTLPGIAGVVLTVGMAVDANVLIFERIREELRNGNSPQASIQTGYEKALSTIADANLTTLIASLALFGFGTGPIKGFAVTLSLGILTSMFTSIMVTRSLVNLIYGGRRLTRLPI